MTLNSEDRGILQQAAAELLDRWSGRSHVRAAVDGDRRVDPQTWRYIVDAGWTGLLIPESLGGSEGGLSAATAVLQELGAHTTPGPFLSSAVLFAGALSGQANASVTQWLPRIADGSAVGSVAVGAVAARLRGGPWSLTCEELPGGGVRFNGSAPLVLDAPVADVFMVIAGSQEGPVVALLDAEPGATVTEVPLIDRTRRCGNVEMGSGISAESDTILARGGEAEQLIDRLTNIAALALTTDAVGAAARALDLSVNYAKDRCQFGRPIGSFQAVKHKLANMYVTVAACQAAIEKAAEKFDSAPLDASTQVAIAAASRFGRSGAGRVVGDAMQVHGGIGYTWEHDCHILMKRAKFAETYLSDGWAQGDRLVNALRTGAA
ncbi:acyl-CoA dehydrogenase family protein [Mycobacterium intracellulare]|uniref:Acyl-CoA dehydrogenase family protein n=2 Tax=Mycobacterium intracellulare subsp. chimaera TaxID=222805 RepID=A0ABT7P888_MYCIT|nr:acyl-CoA dehydrogenase family protein [Mycobacterium intracellulare]MDM3929487.1 acyl-CoA dehydrogenase family protein [Mycobacterium intracellulare subsp. chimaera]